MKKISLAIYILCAQQLMSQNNANVIPKVIPASPVAAGLGSYGATNVSLYTGTPSISVPLYDIKSGSLSLPISLSNHGGGIKVEEVATWVGLGWNLSAGGAIIRNIAGNDDFDLQYGGYGYINQTEHLRDILTWAPIATRQHVLSSIAIGQYDGEPDIFQINCPGLTGKFFYNQDAQAFIFSPNQKTKITHDAQYTEWVLTNTSGIQYTFNVVEENVQSSKFTKTAWFLSQIKDLKTTDVINFEYEAFQHYMDHIDNEQRIDYAPFSTCGGSAASTTGGNNISDIRTYRVKRINFKNGYLKFNKSATQRCDLPGDYKLDNIEQYNEANQLLKKYSFNYSYFKEDPALDECAAVNKTKVRLKLDNIVPKGYFNSVGVEQPPYAFEYFGDGGIVDRLSKAQDHWGYANCGDYSTMIPQGTYNGQILPGANRNSNPACAQLGNIQKIKYPTGGSTSFEFEGNYAWTSNTSLVPNILATLEGPTICSYDQQSGFSINPTHYEEEFEIDLTDTYNQPTLAWLRILASSYNLSDYNFCLVGTGCQVEVYPLVRLYNLNNPTVDLLQFGTFGANSTEKYLYNLPIGTYKLTIDHNVDPLACANLVINCYCQTYTTFHVGVYGPSQTVTIFGNYPVGGLRIKKMIDNDGISEANDIITTYNYNNENGLSSAEMQSKPLYQHLAMNIGNANNPVCTYVKRFSYSNYPLIYTQGSPVGYGKVTVNKMKSGQPEIRSEYFYRTFGTDPDIGDITYPYCKPTSFDWKRGLLIMERQYRKEQSSFTLIKETENEYDIVSPATLAASKSIGVKAGFMQQGADGNDYVVEGQFDVSAWQNYTVANQSYENISEDFTIEKTTERIYENGIGGNSLVTTKEYFYDEPNLLQPTSVKSINSKGEILREKIKYAQQYSMGGTQSDDAGINKLIEKNIVTPIETFESKESVSSGENVLGGTITTYGINSFPKEVFKLNLNSPLSINQFNPSVLNANGSFSKDGNYISKATLEYDGIGNLTGAKKSNDVKLSYLYDYLRAYPIAECTNTDEADIAYTSFEADGIGNFTTIAGSAVADATAPTGKKSYPLSSGTISRTINASKTYIVSLWKTGTVNITGSTLYSTGRTINGWTYVEYLVSNATNLTITGSGNIDELRLYPKNAQMTTYTYEPLVGITSQCDVNNNITYYEYDEFGRLKSIRDKDRNIIKTFDYKYQQ